MGVDEDEVEDVESILSPGIIGSSCRTPKRGVGVFQYASCKIAKSRHISAIRDVLKNS
jgi:hypothetical protein